MSRTILVTIIDESEANDTINKCYFSGDDLTAAESQAILWLREQQKDALDHE